MKSKKGYIAAYWLPVIVKWLILLVICFIECFPAALLVLLPFTHHRLFGHLTYLVVIGCFLLLLVSNICFASIWKDKVLNKRGNKVNKNGQD
ncbi:hypothetical protein [Limosilactobacillus oris]|uniref:hypothetical protein n=1 Tax=Limosilactobacillus oris TaxID=1632 RepID=UPI001958BBB7|nr:hypothetical protein [Limosilactobacillus oris]